MEFKHISRNSEILNGKACIRGTRISVEYILELVASGADIHDIVKKYPHLSIEQVQEAILYSKSNLENDVVYLIDKVS